MAWTSGFFNSVNGDRAYNADQMSAIFEGLITDGVYESVGNKLAVQPDNGMTIQIATGRGWFSKRWVNNDSEYMMTLEESDVTLNRYCAVCVRVDVTDSGRIASPYLKYSDFATNPVKPTMERTETVKEYCLAYIYIPAAATAISASNIEDTRGNTELCGWVTGLIDQLDSTTLFAQFEALFLEWFNGLQDYIDDNVEVQLVNDVQNLKDQCIKSTGTFDGIGWISHDDGTYTQTIAVEGVTADNDIIVAPAAEYADAYAAMGCMAISQGDGTVTFECTDPDDIDMVVGVIIYNF